MKKANFSMEGGEDDLNLRRLNNNIFRLLRMPSNLERAFRADYRGKATSTVRYSVYGLIALYLLVVLPVALLINDPQQDVWRGYAVYPIGVSLFIIWISTQLGRLNDYVEFTLRLGVFVSLSGTIYGAIVLNNTLLGQVANCETIYVLIVAFSLLMLRSLSALSSAIGAFLVAAVAARLNGLHISWVGVFLYFWVPLLICAVTGYLMEHAARRDFIQSLMHQQDKLQMVSEIATLVNDADDVDAMLSLALGRVCAHTGWVAGRVQAMVDAEQSITAQYIGSKLVGGARLDIEKVLLAPLLPWVTRVIDSGAARWQDYNLALGRVDKPNDPQSYPQLHLVFPVKLDNKVLGVLEFFSVRREPPDERLLSLMDNIGYQLGRVFERRRQQRDLKIKALHDVLTGLPNRTYLFDRLRTDIARAKRERGFGFGVLFINVDRFKWINDSLGHLGGDRILVELSRHLQQGVRAEDFVARLGGDEFAILIDAFDEAQAVVAMERILQQLEKPVTVAYQDIHLDVSVGIAMYAPHYTEPEEVLRDAAIAMSDAKQRGRGTFTIFADDMHGQAVGRLKLAAELRQAIKDRQLILYYQPIVCLSSGRVIGFEALSRWQHPERGLLSPVHFIPLAEETGLIVPITEWVLQEAAQQLALWQQAGDQTTSISVNLCASYLTQLDMPDQILAVIAAANIDPSRLHLEITETQIVGNADICMVNINRLREALVEIYIDDFGTGYSSLNYLASFRVNTLKIDKCFLQKLCEGGKDAHIR
jgi:diguanylate cyclase (GGDEF)-like protein